MMNCVCVAGSSTESGCSGWLTRACRCSSDSIGVMERSQKDNGQDNTKPKRKGEKCDYVKPLVFEALARVSLR